MGLFAARSFRAGDLIAPYSGELLTQDQIDTRYGKSDDSVAPYALKLPNKLGIIDAACKRGIASYANDPRNSQKVNSTIDISDLYHFITDSKLVDPVLVATKPIQMGKEIFLSYGDWYWEPKHPDHKTIFKDKT